MQTTVSLSTVSHPFLTHAGGAGQRDRQAQVRTYTYGHIHAGNMTDEKEVMDWKESRKGYVGGGERKEKGRLIYYLLKKKGKNGKL